MSRSCPPGAPAPRRCRPLLGLLAIAAVTTAAPEAMAQRLRYQFGAPGAGVPGQGEHTSGMLTPDQIEACLRRWQALGAMAQAVERDQVRVEGLEAELAALTPAPSRARSVRAAPPPSAAPAVSPQQLAAERQAKTEAVNTERRRYLEAVERYRGAAEGFNAGCALRRYYEDEMQAARTKLGITE